jgi:lipid II:glycine glycyltransferase (peptidoglycan interpeptide bridge formation enzyme)
LIKKSRGSNIIAKIVYFGYYIVMKMQKCDDKNIWNNKLVQQKQSEFLQSWQWGEFQKETGKKPIRLKSSDDIEYQVQGFEHKIFPFFKFVYIPKADITEELLDYLKYKRYMFARVEPIEELQNIGRYEIADTANRQPKNTYILNIGNSYDELFANMHPKTRYNIRLAQKKDVIIKEEKNVDIFWDLNKETFERDKFKSHDKEYYKKMLEMENCYQLTAYFNGEVLASNILVHFGDTVTYLHGASGNKYRNFMAPYLLQWEGIKLAKKIGVQYYDFGGVSPESKENKKTTCFHNYCWDLTHKWTGITRFKVGFGGEVRNYPNAKEIILNPFLYNIFEKAKKVYKRL